MKPTPVNKLVVCSLCDEPWEDHVPDAKGNVSTLECIRLLKTRRTRWVPQPYPVYPWTWSTDVRRPYGSYYTASASNTCSSSPDVNIRYATPDVVANGN